MHIRQKIQSPDLSDQPGTTRTHYYHNVVAYFCCQLVAGLSPWTLGFDPRPAHVIFVMALGQIFL
jgi:hypothetical protein